MAADLWKLSRRLQLFVEKKRKSVSVSPPVVGELALAIALELEFCLLLDRRGFSALWKGRIEKARPVGWHGDDLHLLDENWRVVVWDSISQTKKWATEGADRGYALRGDELILIPSPGRLERRDARTGRVLGHLGIAESAEGFRILGDRVVLFLEDSHLECMRLSTGETLWSLSLREAYRDLAAEASVPVAALPGGDGSSLVLHWRPGLGVLDVVSGRFRWTRELRASGPFCVSHGRVGLLSVGRLFVCDEATGETIVDISRATPTVWESSPITHENRMVVVDAQGYIVTVGLSDGALLGVQKEKGTGFMGCVSVDGRLLVGGRDGALWVYEPNEDAGSASSGAPSPKRARPDHGTAKDRAGGKAGAVVKAKRK